MMLFKVRYDVLHQACLHAHDVEVVVDKPHLEVE